MSHSSPLPTVHQPWPFADDPQTQVFITKSVAKGTESIGTVVHEKGGDWQFLGNADRDESEEPEMICLHCICEKDASLMQLHRLKRGQVAIRDSIGEPWEFMSYRRYQWLFLPWHQRLLRFVGFEIIGPIFILLLVLAGMVLLGDYFY